MLNLFPAAVLSIKMSSWNWTVSLPILWHNHMRAAFLSKKTQSNFLLHLLFTWSKDNNSFFNQCRAFPLSPRPPVSSDTDTISIKVRVLQGRRTRQDDLGKSIKKSFLLKSDCFAMIFKLPMYLRQTSCGSQQSYCSGVFCPLSAQGQLSGTRGTLPAHLPLTLMCKQAGEASHLWDPAQSPQMLKEGLGFGNGEEEP